jgi:hypothetical protein
VRSMYGAVRGSQVSRRPGSLQVKMPLRMHGSELLAFPASSLTLAVASRVFEAFPCARRARRPIALHRVSPPFLMASPVSLRPARVATGRPPEPFASSASSSTLRPMPSPFRYHASVALPCADYPSTSSCLLLEVPLRRFSVRSVHSRSRIETRDLRPSLATERVSFRPRGFSPPRRLSPDRRRERYCSSQPTMGFTVFP